MKKLLIVLITLFFFSAAQMRALGGTEAPDSAMVKPASPFMIPKIEMGQSSLQIFGYAQTLYSYRHTQEGNTNGFDIQRIIVMANAELTRKLSFFLMVDMASGQLHEYYGQYAFTPQLKVRVGQFKQPYTLENIISPSVIDVIDFDPSVLYMCGIASEPGIGNHTARDAGIMITGDLLPRNGRPLFSYQLGLFNGTGRNVKENNNQKSVMGMLNYMPIEPLLISGSFAAGTSRAESGRLDYLGQPIFAKGENYRRLRLSGGFELKTRLVSVRSEYMYGKDAWVPMHGCYGNINVHLLPQRLDLILNADYLDKNAHAAGHESMMTYVGGAQYWFYKRCRIVAEYVRTCPKHGPSSYAILTQLQIGF